MTFMIDIPAWLLYLGGGFFSGIVLSALVVYLFVRLLPRLLEEALKSIWK